MEIINFVLKVIEFVGGLATAVVILFLCGALFWKRTK